VRNLQIALWVSLLVALAGVWLISRAVLQGGTHGFYCPAASQFWIFSCVPTPTALLAGALTGLVLTLVVLPIVWLVVTLINRRRPGK
jgi:hypothetical protein